MHSKINYFMSCMYTIIMCLPYCDALVIYCELFSVSRLFGVQHLKVRQVCAHQPSLRQVHFDRDLK
jgi:hypothetical protein